MLWESAESEYGCCVITSKLKQKKQTEEVKLSSTTEKISRSPNRPRDGEGEVAPASQEMGEWPKSLKNKH